VPALAAAAVRRPTAGFLLLPAAGWYVDDLMSFSGGRRDRDEYVMWWRPQTTRPRRPS